MAFFHGVLGCADGFIDCATMHSYSQLACFNVLRFCCIILFLCHFVFMRYFDWLLLAVRNKSCD